MKFNINLDFLSRFRSTLMGFAIVWIFFYHTGIDIPVLREIFALGWIGVDIFFFISGFGLCASLSKNPSVKDFFKRRFFRIIPTWWLILTIGAVYGSIMELQGFPDSPQDFFYWYTGLGWWTGNCSFEWYIPTLLIFYLWAPFINKCKVKTLWLLMGICMVGAVLLCYYHIFYHVYMSYSRVPDFIFGFICYKMYKSGKPFKAKVWLPMTILGILIIGIGTTIKIKYSDLVLGLTIFRVALPLIMLPLTWGVSCLLNLFRPIRLISDWIGLISLEIYLLHINHEFAVSVQSPITDNVHEYLQKMTWFAVIVAAAYIIHITANSAIFSPKKSKFLSQKTH